jgi:L-lactate permease
MDIAAIIHGICIVYFMTMFAIGITSSIDFIRSCPGLSHEIRSIIVMAILFFAVGVSIIPYIIIGHVALSKFCVEVQEIKKISKSGEGNSK